MTSHRAASQPATVLRVDSASAQYAVLEASSNAVVAIDRHGLISYANRQVETTFGYARDDIVGRPIELLLPERAREAHTAHRAGFLAHPMARPMGIGVELSGRRKDGSEFPVEISLSPIGSGDDVEIFATIVDITTRKALEIVAESERLFRAVLEASPNPVIAVDAQGTISYANPQVEATFGYERDEVLGRPVQALLPEQSRSGRIVATDPVLAPSDSGEIGHEFLGRRKDGSEFPVEISRSQVETADGRRVFATIVDITARKRAEATILQAQKLESIGRLAGGIAHDFNNMLFVINGQAELLDQDLAAPRRATVDLDATLSGVRTIREAGERAATLTGQLLAFSRQQVITPAVVDLNAAITDLEPMVRQLIGENMRLVIRLAGDAGHIRADAGQLDQILVNLVVNARDAMPDGGAVTIETGNVVVEAPNVIGRLDLAPGAYVLLTVTDTGIGMDTETREHIFEPFFTTKKVGKGTGLGLATTYGIVRRTGGEIWVYSEPGIGSSFKLYFPMVDAPITPEAPSVPAAVPLGVGTILVVEDEPAVRDTTIRMLSRAGFEVIGVAHGADAMTRIERLDPPIDVLVTDVIMANMSGIELAEWTMDHQPQIGVVLLSGYTPETLNLERVTARGATFVAKPVTSGQLLAAVQRAQAAPPASPGDGPRTDDAVPSWSVDPDEAVAQILVVDDDASVRGLVARVLRAAAFHVVEAASGEAALGLVETEDIGLVVIDMGLSGMSGTDVVRTLRTRPETVTLPILLMTGSGVADNVIEGLDAGADDFVRKPIRLDELMARVRAHLRRQVAWSHVVEDELRTRASVVSALGHLEISPVPEEAAEAVVGELGKRTESDFVAVLQVGADGQLLELATYNRSAGVRRGGHALAPAVARHVLTMARGGPWVEDVVQETGRIRVSSFAAAAPQLAAGAPIYSGHDLVGILTIGITTDSSASPLVQRTNLLAAAIDYANVLTTRAGAAFADRRDAADTVARLRGVLTKGEFHPVFQPIVALSSRAIVGYEALTRFDDGEPPDVQFAEARRVGLGPDFELAAIREALEAATRLPRDLFLSLNVSPNVVLRADHRLGDLLRGSSRQLVLEVTEHAPIDDYRRMRAALARFDDVGLAIDDAGAGYASLRHILELRPTYAKIDISLVRGIDEDDLRQALAAGLQYFASKIGSRLIAEGIETTAEAEVLQRIGIEFGQGYLFGRPEPAA